MANKLQIKRTSISGRAPNTTSSGNTHFIDTGELALNLTDGKLFSSNGTVSFEVGANLTNASVTNVLTVKAVSANGSNGTAGQVLTSNGTSSYWSTVSGGGGFTNGTSISVDDLEITGSLTANSSTGSSGQILFSNGTGVYWSDPAAGSGGGSGTIVTRTYTGDGACTEFTVTSGVANSSSLVMENGIVQTPSSDYTVSGNTLTFTTAPANGVNIQIRELAVSLDSGGSYSVNSFTAESQITVGNSSVNSVINSTSISADLLYGNGVFLTSISASTLGGNSAADLRNYSDIKASNAYTNATNFSSDANNISFGVINPARLPQANTTSNGAVILLDSVSNTSISIYAASANSVKTAYDAAISAYSNAVSSANSIAATAYTNAASYADTKASDAYTNAVNYSSNADNISSGTLSNSRLPDTIGLSTALYVGNSTVNTAITPSSVDIDGTISVLGVATFSSTVDMSNNTIANVADPVHPLDAVNKQYVDAFQEGLHIHASCDAATTDTLATLTGGSVTYDNGTSGVAATLTLSVALTTLDGYTLATNDRILVKNEANTAHNGIYTISGAKTVLTRATDFDESVSIQGGDFTFVTNGTLYNSTGWVQTDSVSAVGTDAIVFVQFSGQGTYTAGDYLYLTGSQFNANATSTSTASVLIARDSEENFAANTANLNAINVGANLNLTTSAISVGNSTVNTVVDSTSVAVGSSFIANTTGAYHTGTINAASLTTTGITANTTGIYPASNTSGDVLGTSTARWELSANTGDFSGNTNFASFATFATTTDVLQTKTGATGTVTHDISIGPVFLHSSVSASFTANFTNTPTTNDRIIITTIIIAQGGTPYIPSAVEIDGAAQTINWLGGSAPSGGASKQDVFTFALVRSSSTWTVLGNYSSFG